MLYVSPFLYVFIVRSDLSWRNWSRINGSYRIGTYTDLNSNTQYNLRVVALYFTLASSASTSITITTGGNKLLI